MWNTCYKVTGVTGSNRLPVKTGCYLPNDVTRLSHYFSVSTSYYPSQFHLSFFRLFNGLSYLNNLSDPCKSDHWLRCAALSFIPWNDYQNIAWNHLFSFYLSNFERIVRPNTTPRLTYVLIFKINSMIGKKSLESVRLIDSTDRVSTKTWFIVHTFCWLLFLSHTQRSAVKWVAWCVCTGISCKNHNNFCMDKSSFFLSSQQKRK